MTARERSPATVLVALLYIALWSSAFIATKVGVSHSPPLSLLVVRFLVAAALMAGLAYGRRLAPPRGGRAWAQLALFGALNSGLALAFTYEALRQLSAGMGAIITATNPLLLALLAPRLLGERLTPRRLVGLVLGFGGVLFVMAERLGGPGTLDTPLGALLSFLHVVTLVAATIVYKRFQPREHPLVINAVQLAAGGLVLLPPALLFEHPERVRPDAPLLWSFLYLVLISVGASLLWFWLLARGEASVVSAYYFLTPVFGLLLAALLLGEPFGARDGLGLLAIATGIALVSRPATAPGGTVAPTRHPWYYRAPAVLLGWTVPPGRVRATHDARERDDDRDAGG